MDGFWVYLKTSLKHQVCQYIMISQKSNWQMPCQRYFQINRKNFVLNFVLKRKNDRILIPLSLLIPNTTLVLVYNVFLRLLLWHTPQYIDSRLKYPVQLVKGLVVLVSHNIYIQLLQFKLLLRANHHLIFKLSQKRILCLTV